MTPQPSQPLIEKVFGANWRTSVSGIFTTLGAIIVALAALPKDIWQNPAVYIPAILTIAAKTVQDFKTKDANVAGSGAPLDPHRVDDGIAAPRQIPASIIIAILIPVLAFAGCAGWPGKLANFLVSPGNEAVVGLAVQVGVNSLLASTGTQIPAAEQQPLATLADAAANSVSSAFLSAAAAALRSQQGTPQAANPAAISQAVTQAGAAAIAPVTASAVSAIAAKTGLSPSAVNEAAAAVLDSVAASTAVTPTQARAIQQPRFHAESWRVVLRTPDDQPIYPAYDCRTCKVLRDGPIVVINRP